MHGNMHRLTARNFSNWDGFLAAVRHHAVRIAQDGAMAAGGGVLGVWLDDDRRGVSMRVLRDSEMHWGQSWLWRPHRTFALDRVAEDGVSWLTDALR